METAQELADVFGMTSVDYVLLERYCSVSAQIEDISGQISGKEVSPIQRGGGRKAHPLAQFYVQLMKQQTSYATQLGIGISARIKTQRLANTGNGPGTPGSKKKTGNALINFNNVGHG